jgi:4-hydroxy-2-oxoheptanedioate aldolase
MNVRQEIKNFKSRLREDKAVYGFFVGPPSPATVEMVGYRGFDFVIIDQEHGPAGLETLENLCRAADAAGIASIVRVPTGSASDILHVLDAGATGVLVPHVVDADAARKIVGHAHYPPKGKRGISTLSRAGRYGATPASEYLANRGEHTVVIVMIEDQEALPNVATIARVDGVDAVFVGTSDLAASMGHTGNSKHPDVVSAVSLIWPEVLSIRGPALATAARSPSEAKALSEVGVKMFCFNTTSLLSSALLDLKDQLL